MTYRPLGHAPEYTGPKPGGIAERAMEERAKRRWHEWNYDDTGEDIDELPEHSTRKETT